MSLRSKWQKFSRRDWQEVRDAWLGFVPSFPLPGAPPDPGIERLDEVRRLAQGSQSGRQPDITGLRRLALWEAVFLFHKCAHVNSATQRIGISGMHSWCLFNAYHGAFLGAKGIMALLGVVLPLVDGRQLGIDLCPEPERRRRAVTSTPFDEIVLVRFDTHLDQKYLWEGFQRVLRTSEVGCWDHGVKDSLLEIDFADFSKARNNFLYRPRYWPLDDLLVDRTVLNTDALIGQELEIDTEGFLLRLSLAVFRLFDQIMADLATYSGVIRNEIDCSRFVSSAGTSERECYETFVRQTSSPAS